MADVKELVYLRQRAVHHDYVSRLSCYITILAKRNADGRGSERRRVVDPIANKNSAITSRLLPNDLELLLRALSRFDFRYADQIGKILDFRFPITRYQHDPIDAMTRAQMIDKRDAFTARH